MSKTYFRVLEMLFFRHFLLLFALYDVSDSGDPKYGHVRLTTLGLFMQI